MPPTTVLSFPGLEIDSVQQQVKVPAEKLEKLRLQLQQAASKQYLTVKQAQSLVGSLNFVCRAVAPGRTFLRRLIDLTKGIADPNKIVRVGIGAQEDIAMWRNFLDEFNGISMFREANWTDSPDMNLHADAAGE